MLIILPPSENKTQPESGETLSLDTLCTPALNPTREIVLSALIKLSRGNKKQAAEVLGLGPSQANLVSRNAQIRNSPTARADEIYTGVLYDHLNVGSLPSRAKKHLDKTVVIASALYGIVRASDPIAAYRLSGSTTLPSLGSLAGVWKPVLGEAINELSSGGLILDLRSGPYLNLAKPSAEWKTRTVSVRVLNEKNGKRSIVSHFNKATKGDIVRDLMLHRVEATNQTELEVALKDLGWTVESQPGQLDIII